MQSADLNVFMKKLEILQQNLFSQKILRHSNADNARAHYPKFLEEVKNVVVEKEFLYEILQKVICSKYDTISYVVKILLTINHG